MCFEECFAEQSHFQNLSLIRLQQCLRTKKRNLANRPIDKIKNKVGRIIDNPRTSDLPWVSLTNAYKNGSKYDPRIIVSAVTIKAKTILLDTPNCFSESVVH